MFRLNHRSIKVTLFSEIHIKIISKISLTYHQIAFILFSLSQYIILWQVPNCKPLFLFLSGDCETLSCACRRLHGRTRNYSELRIYRNPLLPFSMICCPSNVQQFLRSVGLPGTPSERVRVWLRRRLRISAPTVLFAQSQGEMFKTKYMSSK